MTVGPKASGGGRGPGLRGGWGSRKHESVGFVVRAVERHPSAPSALALGAFSQAHKSQGCSGKASPLRPEPSWSGRMLMKWKGGVGIVVSAKSYCPLQYLGFLVFVFYFKAKSNC